MRFVTLVNELSVADLKAIAHGFGEKSVSDVDFLETLSAHKCFLLPPWVMRADPAGGLHRVCKLRYDYEGNIEKSRVLLAVAKSLSDAEGFAEGIGGRFGE